MFARLVRTDPLGGSRTRLLRHGDEVTLNAYFRHSRVKSYLKEGRAFRIETWFALTLMSLSQKPFH